MAGQPVSYHGQGFSLLRDKNRFVLPSSLRAKVRESSGKDVLCLAKFPDWKCLVGFGLSRIDEFEAELDNLGGGGVGLVVPREHRAGIDSSKVFWLRMDLRPTIPAPIVLTAKCVHSHIDSQQNTYAGMAFEFGVNNQHKDFVLKQMARYIGSLQPRRKAA